MTRSFHAAALATALCAAALGLSSAMIAARASAVANVAAPDSVPAALQPPADQEPFASLKGAGVQIYECARKPDAPNTFAWEFREPDATLSDANGDVVGRHFAGPSWAAVDGSTIVGKVSASLPAPLAGAIPWLRLDVGTHEGQGLFDHATSVQRLDTIGGVAPALACGTRNEHQKERVGYTAIYVFWRARDN